LADEEDYADYDWEGREEDYEDYETGGLRRLRNGMTRRDEENYGRSSEEEPWYVRILPHFYWPAALAFVLLLVALVFLPKEISGIVGAALFFFAFFGLPLILAWRAEPREWRGPKLDKREKMGLIGVLVIIAGALTATMTAVMTPIGEAASPTAAALLFGGMGIMFLGACFCIYLALSMKR